MSKITEDIMKKYKNNNSLERYYYTQKNEKGQFEIIDGIVNPIELDFRQMVCPVDNQGDVPSCAAHSICSIAESLIWQKTGKLVNLDPFAVYAKAKELDGNSDDGTTLENAIKAAFQLGGFDVSKIKINTFFNDRTNLTVELMKHLIHKHLFVHVGFAIKSGWYDCNNENYYINHNGCDLGGHAMVATGYLNNATDNGLILLNSWGKEWGSKGFCLVKWEDVLKSLIYFCTIDGLFEGL